VERPRRVVRFARLIHRRVRAFGPAFGRRRLRRQSQPALVATHRGTARPRPWRSWYPSTPAQPRPGVGGVTIV